MISIIKYYTMLQSKNVYVSINTFKFNSDVKIIRMQRKSVNGEITLKINEQQTNVIKLKRKISTFELIL